MALAFEVDCEPDSIAYAFAAHDEYLSIFNHYANGGKHHTMTPAEEYYTVPFCFMPDLKNPVRGFIVFTAQVPWLHGFPRDEDKCLHERARAWQKNKGTFEEPFVGTVEQFQDNLHLKEHQWFPFTHSGNYPSKEEISQELENRAVKVTCAAMGWKIPENWRIVRNEMKKVYSPVMDLSEWDRRKTTNSSNDSATSHMDEIGGNKRMKYSNASACSDNEQEEKKVHDSVDRQMAHLIDPISTLISLSRESGENEEKKDSSHTHSYESGHLDKFYGEDTSSIYEDHRPYLGYQYEEGPVGYEGVEQGQNVDSFYDYDAENEQEELHCV